MTKKQKIASALRIDECREEAKKLFRQAGKLLDKLVAECEVGEMIDLPDGRTAIVIDNFDGKNTAFKPAVGFNQYDIQITEF